MSNFPPGVTGNERQIRGWDEAVVRRECHAQVDMHVMPAGEWYMLKEILKTVKKPLFDKNLLVGNLEQLERFMSEWDEKMLLLNTDDCVFEGEVDVQYGDGNLWWECPLCGTEHEEEMEDLRP